MWNFGVTRMDRWMDGGGRAKATWPQTAATTTSPDFSSVVKKGRIDRSTEQKGRKRKSKKCLSSSSCPLNRIGSTGKNTRLDSEKRNLTKKVPFLTRRYEVHPSSLIAWDEKKPRIIDRETKKILSTAAFCCAFGAKKCLSCHLGILLCAVYWKLCCYVSVSTIVFASSSSALEKQEG